VRIANSQAAVAAVLARWPRTNTRVIFEATGSYDRVLRAALDAAGILYVHVNPVRHATCHPGICAANILCWDRPFFEKPTGVLAARKAEPCGWPRAGQPCARLRAAVAGLPVGRMPPA
jgi:hypothetical protein